MSIISTLRNKMGKFLVFIIGFSIASFVLSDILGPNSTLFGGNDTTIGTCKGRTKQINVHIAQRLLQILHFY